MIYFPFYYNTNKRHFVAATSFQSLLSGVLDKLPIAALRLRTDAAKRYKKTENATAVIWKMLLLAEQRFRRLDAPDKLTQVYLGISFREGAEIKREEVLAVA